VRYALLLILALSACGDNVRVPVDSRPDTPDPGVLAPTEPECEPPVAPYTPDTDPDYDPEIAYDGYCLCEAKCAVVLHTEDPYDDEAYEQCAEACCVLWGDCFACQ
jgi:hypothetical protein